MKQPSLEEVKEYFKNAEKVKDWKKYKGLVTFENLEVTGTGDVVQNPFGKNWIVLYHSEHGYAKILTYKEKTFSITESQIKDYSKEREHCLTTQHVLRELFPEAFESEFKLEVGKWYRAGHYLICLKEIDGNSAGVYGFSEDTWYEACSGFKIIRGHFKLKEATEQEVFEALKNEAVKRGFVEGIYFDAIYGKGILKLGAGEPNYYSDDNSFYTNGFIVFKDGKWAEIIEAITLSEAEQQLKKKIIV